MAIRKIIRVDEPHKDDRSYRGGLFRLWYVSPEGTEYPRDVCQLEHDRIVFEQKMLSNGISEADIEKYKELLRAEIQEETDFTGCVNCG